MVGAIGAFCPFLLAVMRATPLSDPAWGMKLGAQLLLGGIVAWVLPGENRFVTFYHGLTAPVLIALLSAPHGG